MPRVRFRTKGAGGGGGIVCVIYERQTTKKEERVDVSRNLQGIYWRAVIKGWG